MSLICNVFKCDYNKKLPDMVCGFCTLSCPSIDENGMCSQLWKNGQRKELVKELPQNDFNIEYGEFNKEEEQEIEDEKSENEIETTEKEN